MIVALLLVAAAFPAALAVAGSAPPGAEPRGAPSTATVDTANATLETNRNGEVILRNGPRQTIGGEANVAPETNLTVHVRIDSGTVDFEERLGATVRDDGTFEVTTDAFADRGSGLRFTAWVSRNGTRISPRYDGMMLSYDPGSVTFADQRVASPDGTVVVRAVTVSYGGFVSVRQGNANGSVLGASDYLRPGMHENVSVDIDRRVSGNETLVAVLHRDSDGDERWDFPERDGPFLVDGSTIHDAATVAGQTPSPSPRPTLSPSPTTAPATTVVPAPTDVPTTTGSPSPSAGTNGTDARTRPPATTGDGPGFGVAVGLAALLAAALLTAGCRD
jgi:PGF-CTERM protein